jgi:hypothetical protein
MNRRFRKLPHRCKYAMIRDDGASTRTRQERPALAATINFVDELTRTGVPA